MTTASSGLRPPALLALGCDIADRKAQQTTTDFDVADLAQNAVHRVALDVPSRAHMIGELERKAEDYLALAREWLEAHSDHPWQAKLSHQRQAWPADASQHAPSESDFSPPSGYFGHGVWRPRRGGLETTTMIEGWPSQWRISYRWPPEVQLKLWSFAVRPSARLLEIHEAEDWRQLTERYPVLVESRPLVEQPDVTLPAPLYLPDWSKVAKDWDGVRMTMGGILASAYVVQSVLDGYTLLNDQIADERTLWMNWVFEGVGDEEVPLPAAPFSSRTEE